MDVFVSWSGGKDCMFALYKTTLGQHHSIKYLVNVCDEESEKSRSHGLSSELIKHQATAMGIDIIQPKAGMANYETVFKETIVWMKQKGISGGVFGDIYLKEHRDWIERVCAETGIEAIFPLWENDTVKLVTEFTNAGFRTLLVAVNQNLLPRHWLGREIDPAFIADIVKLNGIDPCAENGEYHSFVFDGPLFKHPVEIKKGNEYFLNNHWFLELN